VYAWKVPKVPGKLYVKANSPGEKIVKWELRDLSGYARVKDEIMVRPPNVVGVAGDTHAVEAAQGANTDNINLRMVRISGNLADALTVQFEFIWGENGKKLQESDVSLPDNITKITDQKYTIYIPADENESETIVIMAQGDDLVEGLERDAWIEVLSRVAGSSYLPTKVDTEIAETAQYASPQQELSVMDGITLYGPENEDEDLKDHNSPGIHWNDVRQGYLFDCSFCTALIALADHNGQSNGRDHIQSELISETPAYTVNFFVETGGRHSETVDAASELLQNGYNMVQLTGDYKEIKNDEDEVTQKLTEVWPIVVENAYAQWWEGYGPFENGHTLPGVWKHLTGQSTKELPASNPREDDTIESDELPEAIKAESQRIFQTIKNERAKGKIICVGTRDSFADEAIVDAYDKNLGHNHAYYVSSIEDTENNKAVITLLNPWGEDHKLHLKIEDSCDVLSCIYVLDPV